MPQWWLAQIRQDAYLERRKAAAAPLKYADIDLSDVPELTPHVMAIMRVFGGDAGISLRRRKDL